MKPAQTILFALVLSFLLSGCTDYGESVEFGKSKVYYKDGVAKEEAQKLGDFLNEAGVLSEEEARDVQLVKEGDTYSVRFVVKESDITDDLLAAFGNMKGLISTAVLPGKKVRIQLANDHFEPYKDI